MCHDKDTETVNFQNNFNQPIIDMSPITLDGDGVEEVDGRGNEDSAEDNPEVVVGLTASVGAQSESNQETLAGTTASHSHILVP